MAKRVRSGNGYCRGCKLYVNCAFRSAVTKTCELHEPVIPRMLPPVNPMLFTPTPDGTVRVTGILAKVRW